MIQFYWTLEQKPILTIEPIITALNALDYVIGFYQQKDMSKRAVSRDKDKVSNKEVVTLGPLLFLSSTDMERKFELNNLLARKSVANVIFSLCTPAYIFCAFWPNLLRRANLSHAIIPLFVASAFLILSTTIASCYVIFQFPPEDIINSSTTRFLFALTGYSHFFCYAVLYFLQAHFGLCHPVSLHCHEEEFPVDLFFVLMFGTILTQLAFPCLSWGYALSLQIVSCLFIIACIPLYNSAAQLPAVFLGAVCITGSVLVRRRDAIGYFRLTLKIEQQTELEQQAKLGDRLRMMISGVAHDLKSPLSALSLGLGSIPSIYESVRALIYSDFAQEERIRRSELLLETIEDLGLGMDHSRHAMATIIGRCVDINQALNGIPLIPTIQEIDVPKLVEKVVNSYTEENQQVSITVDMDNSVRSIDTDGFWLQESLSCLLSNAIKFCDYSTENSARHSLPMDGLRRVEVVVSKTFTETSQSGRSSTALPAEDCFLRVEVWDEGVGIDEDMEMSLFTFLGHSQQVRVGGAGLGLGSLACRIRTLGGRYGYIARKKIDVNDLTSRKIALFLANSSCGSIFWFEIPYKISKNLREQWKSTPTSVNARSKRYLADIDYAHDEALKEASPAMAIPPSKVASTKATEPVKRKSIFMLTSRVVPSPGSSKSSSISVSAATVAVTANAQSVADGKKAIQKRTEEVRSQLMGYVAPSNSINSNISSTSSATPRSSTWGYNASKRFKLAEEPDGRSFSKTFRPQIPSTPTHYSRRSPYAGITTTTTNTNTNTNPNTANAAMTMTMTNTAPHNSNQCSNQNTIPESATVTTRIAPVGEQDISESKSTSLLVVVDKPTGQREEPSAGTEVVATQLPLAATTAATTTISADISPSQPLITTLKTTTTTTTTKQLESDSGKNSGGDPSSPSTTMMMRRPTLTVTIPATTTNGEPATNEAGRVMKQTALMSTATASMNVVATIAAMDTHVSTGTIPSKTLSAAAAAISAVEGKRILVVDDSMPIRKMSSMILKQHGHHVVTAMNGKEALQMMIQAFDLRIQRHRSTQLHADQKNDADYYASSNSNSNSGVAEFDLVLMDIQMPVMDGIEAVALYRRHETQQLQKLAQLNNNSNSNKNTTNDTTNDTNDGNNHQNSSSDGVRRLLIIGMSACSDVDTIERGLSVGMDRFVAKPFQIQQLTPILQEHSTWTQTTIAAASPK